MNYNSKNFETVIDNRCESSEKKGRIDAFSLERNKDINRAARTTYPKLPTLGMIPQCRFHQDVPTILFLLYCHAEDAFKATDVFQGIR